MVALTDEDYATAERMAKTAIAGFDDFIEEAAKEDPDHAAPVRALQKDLDQLASPSGACGLTLALAVKSTSVEENQRVLKEHMKPLCELAIAALRGRALPWWPVR